MAQFTIPAASSVVDYLNSNKQDSSFGARTKLYSEAGLDKRLGSFTGSSSQNLALLDFLKTKGAAPAQAAPSAATNPLAPFSKLASPFTSLVAPLAKGLTPSATSAASIASQPKPSPLTGGASGPIDFGQISMKTPTATDTFNFAQRPGVSTPADFSKLTVAPAAPPVTSATQVAQTIAPSTPAPSADGTAPVGGETATTTITSETIYPSASPTEGDLVNEFLTSEEGRMLLEKRELGEMSDQMASEEAKRLLEAKYQSDRTTLEQNLAESGLAFSGIRNTQLKALSDNLAASELNLDRKLASKLLESNLTLREGILKGVEDLIKRAADKDKEAIQQLNAVGLAVVNGELVPTLASRNADRAAEQQEIANARAQANFELSERRLAISEANAARAEARFQQLYGAEKTNEFALLRAAMDAAPDASQEELLAWALENTNLSSTEANAVLAIQPITPNQMTAAAKALVGQFFGPDTYKGLLKTKNSAIAKARDQAKKTLSAAGGALKVNNRTITLSAEDIAALSNIIDTISIEDAEAINKGLKK